MSKPKRNVSSNALLRRKQFLTEVAVKDEETPDAETPQATSQTAVEVETDAQKTVTPATQPEPQTVRETAPESLAPEPAPEPVGLTKRQLLQQYLAAKNKEVETDIIYFPIELYAAFRSVWYERKKAQRGFKKSHIVIEALLRHPDVIAELQRQGKLKS